VLHVLLCVLLYVKVFLYYVLQRAAVCCSVLQGVAVWCSVRQCAAVRCSVLQCVEVCCGVAVLLDPPSKISLCIPTNRRKN